MPFVGENVRFDGVDFRRELGIVVQEESSLSSFYNGAFHHEKMHGENGYS